MDLESNKLVETISASINQAEAIEKAEPSPLRDKIVLLLATGLSAEKIANQLGVSRSTVDRTKADKYYAGKLSLATDALYGVALAKLSLGVESAIDKLTEIIENPDSPNRDKLKAIEILLNHLGTNYRHR